MSKKMLRVVEIALETRQLTICNLVLSMPFLFLFLYFARALGIIITSTPTTIGLLKKLVGQIFFKCLLNVNGNLLKFEKKP
jgi:hypothetical protein